MIGVSIDSHFTHNAWRNTPVNNGGIGQVKYTLAADMTHEICKAYDVESEGGVAFRGAFLIDTNGVVRSQIINDLPLGRNMDELLRLVDALQFHEEHGEVCPANWKKGDKGMNASPEGAAALPERERWQAVIAARIKKPALVGRFFYAVLCRPLRGRARSHRFSACLTAKVNLWERACPRMLLQLNR